MDRSWGVPAAIVLAGGVIGLGVYLGLRTSAPTPASVPGERPRAEAPPRAIANAEVEDVVAAHALAESRARAAIDEIHDTLVEKCWNPSAAKNPEPAAVTVGLSLAFDAAGRMRATGVSERREAYRSDLADCLTETVHGVSIEGVGMAVSLEVDLQLPRGGRGPR